MLLNKYSFYGQQSSLLKVYHIPQVSKIINLYCRIQSQILLFDLLCFTKPDYQTRKRYNFLVYSSLKPPINFEFGECFKFTCRQQCYDINKKSYLLSVQVSKIYTSINPKHIIINIRENNIKNIYSRVAMSTTYLFKSKKITLKL